MPGIATHHVFGTDVFAAAVHVDEAQVGKAGNLDAFLLGNQGPDPLFYLAATLSDRQLRRIGSTMHRYNTVELMQAMHERFIADGTDTVLAAYALGFMCHYILDSTVHPLVYAQEYAICSKGVEPLRGEWPHRVVHATIETSIDEYVLTTKRGATAATMPPHKMMLYCPAPKLQAISRAMADVVNRVYGLECPESAFVTAVGLYRASQAALDSMGTGVRNGLDVLSLGSGAVAYARALSHRLGPLLQTPFTNDDHTAWPNPFEEGQVVSASFDELYALSQAKARDILPAFSNRRANAALFEGIVGNVNFLGRAVARLPENERQAEP